MNWYRRKANHINNFNIRLFGINDLKDIINSYNQ